MAGVTDVAFRQLCIEQGADLAYTEMVSAKGLSYANEKTRGLIDVAPNESQVGVQLFGHEPLTMAKQAEWVASHMGENLALIDINMGCPARKIVKKGDGSALMKDPDLAASITREVSRSVGDVVPVTVKFRRGWDIGHESAPDFAKVLEAAGARALTIHGRFAQQLYHGCADWGCIRRVKDSVAIPVVGNGDVKSADDVVAIVRETGCDAVMIARAAQGNPWIFAQAKAALAGESITSAPDAAERIEAAKRHARLLDGANKRSIVRMRKHAAWYLHGLPGASKAREALMGCCSLEDFEHVLDDMSARLENAT